MRIRYLEKGLLACLSIAVMLIFILRAYSCSFHVVDLSYQANAIEVRSQLEWRFCRPAWLPQDEIHPEKNLSFVSATIKDSQGRLIPVDEVRKGDFFPDDFLQGDRPIFDHVGQLQPRVPYDLSHGGTLTMQMEVRGESPSEPVQWRSELSTPLPPTPNFGNTNQ